MGEATPGSRQDSKLGKGAASPWTSPCSAVETENINEELCQLKEATVDLRP